MNGGAPDGLTTSTLASANSATFSSYCRMATLNSSTVPRWTFRQVWVTPMARELGYDPNDVCEVRLADTVIEVDFIDFTDPNKHLVTRRHTAPASPS